MNTQFIKKYIKEPLSTIRVYGFFRKYFFYFQNIFVWLLNLVTKIFRRHASILLYHRIANVSSDPVMLCVTQEKFEEHITYLKKHFDIIPLFELSRRLISKTLVGNEISITFDDGYQDNMVNALPILEKYNVPATIFITTSTLGKTASFDWDNQYTDSDRAVFLSPAEIISLSQNTLIEIGAHTNTHKQLSSLSIEKQYIEIQASKKILEEITGKKIRLFAYPFGLTYDFNENTIKIVKELGFDFAYSNTQLLATKTKRYFSIPRINIRQATNICDI